MDKKEKKIRIENRIVEEKIRELLPQNKYITPKEIADLLDIPEKQVKEILTKLCDLMTDGKKKYYKLNEEEF